MRIVTGAAEGPRAQSFSLMGGMEMSVGSGACVGAGLAVGDGVDVGPRRIGAWVGGAVAEEITGVTVAVLQAVSTVAKAMRPSASFRLMVALPAGQTNPG